MPIKNDKAAYNFRSGSSADADRRSLFVHEYLIDRNGTQAAIRAGYAPKSAHTTANRLLKDAKVAAEIAAATAAHFDRLEVTKDRLTRELAKIAFADLRDFLTWGPEEKAIVDPTTGTVIGKTSGVSLKPSAEIGDDAAGVIAEIGETQTGLKVKLHDKLAAVKMLGQELGMFKERAEVDFNGSLRLIVDAVQREAAALPVNDPNAGRQLREAEGDAARPAPSAPAAAASPLTISPLLRRQGA